MDNISKIKIGKYLHYKGKTYQVIGVARHSETLEEFVVYTKDNDVSMWVRPYKMFTENVFVAGKSVPRFKFLE